MVEFQTIINFGCLAMGVCFKHFLIILLEVIKFQTLLGYLDHSN